jgi:hypothetical protein
MVCPLLGRSQYAPYCRECVLASVPIGWTARDDDSPGLIAEPKADLVMPIAFDRDGVRAAACHDTSRSRFALFRALRQSLRTRGHPFIDFAFEPSEPCTLMTTT